MRLRITIAYDGRDLSGWQSQLWVKTVQDELADASIEICGRRLIFHGSGRTDAGVHALGQVAHVDVPESETMGPEEWMAALNSRLAPTIRVVNSEEAAEDFHAQYAALGKTYRYRIAHGPVLLPQLAGRAWHLHGDLDPEAMAQAAELFIGEHDFGRFCASRGKDREGRSQDPENTRREIHGIGFVRRSAEAGAGEILDLEFSGNGFLYKMVRMLTGAIARCGQGRLEIGEIEAMLANPGGERFSCVAPADGLTLMWVDYG